MITKFSPNLTISFCSPEAARISFGLGIKHILFSDSPHAEAVMKLSIPLSQKLLIPWVIPKKEFERFGISGNNIIHYRSIDAAVIVKNKSNMIPFYVDKSKKTIVIRPEESEAAYIKDGKNSIRDIIAEFSKVGKEYNIIVLARYYSQKNMLKKKYGDKVKVLDKMIDGKSLLSVTDVFIGSGGTMTAESALMGIPTISFDAVPNYIEKYLVRAGLVRRETDPKKVVQIAKQMLYLGNKNKRKASEILNSMEDPFTKLNEVIKTIR